MVKRSSVETSLQTACDERDLTTVVEGGWIRHRVAVTGYREPVYVTLEMIRNHMYPSITENGVV